MGGKRVASFNPYLTIRKFSPDVKRLLINAAQTRLRLLFRHCIEASHEQPSVKNPWCSDAGNLTLGCSCKEWWYCVTPFAKIIIIRYTFYELKKCEGYFAKSRPRNTCESWWNAKHASVWCLLLVVKYSAEVQTWWSTENCFVTVTKKFETVCNR